MQPPQGGWKVNYIPLPHDLKCFHHCSVSQHDLRISVTSRKRQAAQSRHSTSANTQVQPFMCRVLVTLSNRVAIRRAQKTPPKLGNSVLNGGNPLFSKRVFRRPRQTAWCHREKPTLYIWRKHPHSLIAQTTRILARLRGLSSQKGVLNRRAHEGLLQVHSHSLLSRAFT